MDFNALYQEEIAVLEAVSDSDIKNLMVFNDDVNTFDHVIKTLVKICQHTVEQAEQCAYIIHYTGKCSVKCGMLNELKPMARAICDAGIDARVV